MTLQDILLFLERHNYDLRESGNARWIDQKCTPDVLWSISDFVLNYVDNISPQFNKTDIWKSEYASQTIMETYSKPGTNEEAAKREYDKVFGQPLCLLCYAGVLRDISDSPTRHLYEIENREILEYIALNDVNSMRFLQCYIEKVLRDSGLFNLFESFFANQDRAHFTRLKTSFINFYHLHTGVNGDFEPKRIFTKVLNPLAVKYGKKGTESGHLSMHPITRSDLMYNQDNFRDIYREKPKNITRQDWLAQHPEFERRDGYFEQMMARAKATVKDINSTYRNGVSELTQFSPLFDDNNPTLEAHHIFLKAVYPEIKHYLENLILLTPNQHYGFAHPNGNTHVTDDAAQIVLMIAKTESIKNNLESQTEYHIYDFNRLLYVLKVGFDDDSALEIAPNDYIDVVHFINAHTVTQTLRQMEMQL